MALLAAHIMAYGPHADRAHVHNRALNRLAAHRTALAHTREWMRKVIANSVLSIISPKQRILSQFYWPNSNNNLLCCCCLSCFSSRRKSSADAGVLLPNYVMGEVHYYECVCVIRLVDSATR